MSKDAVLKARMQDTRNKLTGDSTIVAAIVLLIVTQEDTNRLLKELTSAIKEADNHAREK